MHIQDPNEANTTLKDYFGYGSRVLPCTKDEGTCEYLDAIYHMQELHVLYSWIFWVVLVSIFGGWWIVRRLRTARKVGLTRATLLDVWCERAAWAKRRWGLRDVPRWTGLRGVSRLQVAVLAGLAAYMLVFSLVGIVYRMWVTPIEGSSLHNTRLGWLGGISDRIAVLAFALTPFTILLAMRESILSQITGIPYQHFNFLHRWTGRIIFAQASLHTFGWTLVEGKLYQPQPAMYAGLMAEQYIIFGVVAMFLLSLMLVLATGFAIQRTGYGVFKIAHWALAVLYIGACWGHWDKLWCYMVPSLALIVIDQALQWLRTAYLHSHLSRGLVGFNCANAKVSIFSSPHEGAVIRLDFEHSIPASHFWQAGQHFMLCFPALSIWHSHPVTIASLPEPGRQQQHTYLLRVRSGQTAKLAALGHGATTPVIMTGPYGTAFPDPGVKSVLTVAGGTGVTFTLPIMLQALRESRWRRPQIAGEEKVALIGSVVTFVWIVKKAECLLWLEKELVELKKTLDEYSGLRVKVFVTRDSASLIQNSSGSDAGYADDAGKQADFSLKVAGSRSILQDLVQFEHPRWSVKFLDGQHPSISEIVSQFIWQVDEQGGGTAAEILGSGPEGMGSGLRAAVADVKGHVRLSCYWDSRHPISSKLDYIKVVLSYIHNRLLHSRHLHAALRKQRSDITSAPSDPMAPIIHCVRHAQGYHNLNVANHSMHDPLLTPLGEQQCRRLAQAFPYHESVEAVVASPIKRTMYTALLGFGTDIANKGLKVIALPELQETSDLPCDTGSSPAEVAQEFERKPVDLSLLTEDWCSKRGKYAPHAQAIEARAREARKWLMAREEKEIVLVTHGGFLHYFTEDWTGSDRFQGTGWANTEFRSYTFSTHDPTNAHLIETPASRKRRLGHEKPLDQNEQEQLKRTATKDWDEKGYVQDNGADKAKVARARLADTRRDDIGGGMASYL